MGSNLLHAQHEHHVTMAKAGKNVYIAMMDTIMADMHNLPTGSNTFTSFQNFTFSIKWHIAILFAILVLEQFSCGKPNFHFLILIFYFF